MLLYLIGKLTMFKNWLIASGLLIAGVAAAILFGRKKQKSVDAAEVKEAVESELERITNVAREEQAHAQARPDIGPDSAADKLRDDWSER